MGIADHLYKQEPKEENSNIIKPEECFGNLLHIRDVLYLVHLYPTHCGELGSGWEHKALGDFNDNIIGLIDGLIESYQGKYGVCEIVIPESKREEPIKVLTDKVVALESYKDSSFKDSWVLNQLDEIITLIYQTIYKLKELK